MEAPPESEAAAAPEGISKEPQFRVLELRQPQGKSNPNTLCKALIVVALLLVVPLFPSRAPEFVAQGNFTEVWEIFHLLFIGIAVSYGLFCRRTDRAVDRERIGNGDSDAYLSGISQFSSFFEGGFDNMCGPDEQDVMRVYGDCQCLLGSGDCILGQNKCAIHGNFTSVASNDLNGNSFHGNGENVSQALCSQYVKSESLVVVSNGKYSVGGGSDFKPLNLPVRSLRSGIVENENVEMKSRCDFSLKGEPKSNDDVKVVKIRGVVPVNLEKKFDEVAGPSSIPWRSNSGRMGSGEERNDARLNAHCRPHSVGEIEFEHIRSRSFLGPNFSSSPELVSSSVENVESRKIFPVSRSKVAPLNGDVSFGSGKMRLPGIGNHGEEDKVGKGKQAIESLESDTRSSSHVNVLSKVKSVRTIKPRRYVLNDKEQHLGHIDCKFGRTPKKFEADSLVKRGSEEEPENHPVSHWNHEFDSVLSMPNPKPSLGEFCGEEKEGINDQNVMDSEDEMENKFDKSSCEENTKTYLETDSELEGSEVDRKATKTYLETDSELEGSEVDRKAGEFIAKFRAQIRLQKASSAEG